MPLAHRARIWDSSEQSMRERSPFVPAHKSGGNSRGWRSTEHTGHHRDIALDPVIHRLIPRKRFLERDPVSMRTRV